MSNQGNNTISEWKLYMYLLRCAIRGEKLQPEVLEQYKDIESSVIRECSRNNNQTFLMDIPIDEYARFRGEEVNNNIKEKKIKAAYMMGQYKCIRDVLELAKKNNIQLIMFKGCVLADLYPQYSLRSSCDSDIFVYREYRQAAIDMLLNMGYVINEEHSKNEVCVLQYTKFPHTIELHTCLWEDYTGKRLDILEELNLTDKNTLIELETCGFKVTTLGYEEHLIFQIFHIVKHFSLEGIGNKYLADIALYVDKYGKYIDYDHLWKALDRLDYSKFAYYMFVVCSEFLGMDKSILEGKEMDMGDEFMDFVMDLFNGGTVGVDKKESWQIFGMMTPYFTGEKKASKNTVGRKLAVVFPRAKDLQDCFGYAKKCPILLPVAWGHRAILFADRKYIKKEDMYSANEKLELADKRLDLMDKMGLMG